jgi:hypothetical protein
LDEVVESLSALEDPRSGINRRHPLPSVLVIAVLAVLAGAAGPTAIARWGKFKADLLTGILDLPRGVPGKDVFRRVLMPLKPDAFEACFNTWIRSLRDEAVAETGVERPIVAIDGKTARRCHDAGNGPGAVLVLDLDAHQGDGTAGFRGWDWALIRPRGRPTRPGLSDGECT